jgi:uncharacterized protein
VIIDLHRHLWSIFERYPAVREIAARAGVAGVHRNVEAPVQDADARAAEIGAEREKAGVDRSCLLLRGVPVAVHTGPMAAGGTAATLMGLR